MPAASRWINRMGRSIRRTTRSWRSASHLFRLESIGSSGALSPSTPTAPRATIPSRSLEPDDSYAGAHAILRPLARVRKSHGADRWPRISMADRQASPPLTPAIPDYRGSPSPDGIRRHRGGDADKPCGPDRQDPGDERGQGRSGAGASARAQTHPLWDRLDRADRPAWSAWHGLVAQAPGSLRTPTLVLDRANSAYWAAVDGLVAKAAGGNREPAIQRGLLPRSLLRGPHDNPFRPRSRLGQCDGPGVDRLAPSCGSLDLDRRALHLRIRAQALPDNVRHGRDDSPPVRHRQTVLQVSGRMRRRLSDNWALQYLAPGGLHLGFRRCCVRLDPSGQARACGQRPDGCSRQSVLLSYPAGVQIRQSRWTDLRDDPSVHQQVSISVLPIRPTGMDDRCRGAGLFGPPHPTHAGPPCTPPRASQVS